MDSYLHDHYHIDYTLAILEWNRKIRVFKTGNNDIDVMDSYLYSFVLRIETCDERILY